MDAVPLLDRLAGAFHHRQCDQAQEIHLEHAQRIEDAHLELRDRFDRRFLRVGGGAVQRQVFENGFIRNDHTRCVRAGVADGAFHFCGDIDQLMQVRLVVVDLLEFRKFQGIFHGRVMARDEWHELCHAVDFVQGDVHHAPNITQGGLGAHGAKGDDLCDPVASVFGRAILQHLGAAIVLKVEVNIGHRDPPGVQEAFEQQVVLQRIDQRDLQDIGHDGTICGTARVVPNTPFTRVLA